MRILFVCLGNICRSPSAHGVVRHHAAQAGLRVRVDSAGTGGWHRGDPPDRRAIRAAAARGYDLSDLRARQITAADFTSFDRLYAMDHQNLRDIEALRPAGNTTPAALFLDLLGPPQQEVPDPYYDNSFGRMLDLIERGAEALLRDLMQKGVTPQGVPPRQP